MLVIVLLVLLAAIAATSVEAKKVTPAPDNGGLIIVSAYDMQPQFSANAPAGYSALSVYTIRQGQTNWYVKYISQGCPYYIIDLNWGNSANSLQIRVYGADGYVYGPFYDNADGRIDGRIALYVTQSGGLTGGYYYHEVYGYRVSGIEDYTC